MLCPQCGREIHDKQQAFCSYCGQALAASRPSLNFDLSLPTPAGAAAVAPAPASPAQAGFKGLLIAGAILAWKFKAVVIALLLKAKSLFVLFKFSKVLTTGSTMLLSIVIYAQTWGWRFATAFFVLVLFHEMGHVLVAWRKGLPVSAPMFIPGLGALITLKQNPRDALTESHIGYGGPALGALGDSVFWGLSALLGQPVLLAAANFSMLVNLFNMVPVSPLDGGRIVAAISPRIWLLGLMAMIVGFLSTHSPIMFIVILLGGLRLIAQWRIMNTAEYFQIAARDRLIMTVLYLGLALYLGAAHSYTTHQIMEWIRINAPSVRT